MPSPSNPPAEEGVTLYVCENGHAATVVAADGGCEFCPAELRGEPIQYVPATPQQRGEPTDWTCEHGVTFTGSDDFISGARNAHLSCGGHGG